EHVDGDDAAAALRLHFEEGAGRDMLDLLGGPVPADDVTAYHGLVLSIVRPRARARSLARGVTVTPGPSSKRASPRGNLLSVDSVTTPLSMRWDCAAGAEGCGAGADAC